MTSVFAMLSYKFRIILILLLVFFASCKKLVEIDAPKTEVVTATVYSDDATAISAIRGIYSEMMGSGHMAGGGEMSVTFLSGLSADEYENYYSFSDVPGFYTADLNPLNTPLRSGLWEAPYKYIYYANSVLEGLNHATGVTAATKKQLTGEALFIRAFCNFYLVNLFGNIPLISTTDYVINKTARQNTVQEVYKKIKEDLMQAEQQLANDYSASRGERVRPNKWVASAFLARVYLYNKEWDKAEAEASQLIGNTTDYALLKNLDAVFIKNSKEAIWQLMPVIPGINTLEGTVFIPWDVPFYMVVSNSLINAFEAGDARLNNWISSITTAGETYQFPYKYKVMGGNGEPLTEYSMVFRLAEQYLIRAEARAMQNKLPEAINDVDAIRDRAKISLIRNTNPSISQAALLLAIEEERRRELFSEWGHRWLDLKRTDRANVVLGPVKGMQWQKEDQLYPIPQSELNNNPNLEQNYGYK